MRGVLPAMPGIWPASNAVSAAITVAGGRVERIESRYPSLEEMLVAVGK